MIPLLIPLAGAAIGGAAMFLLDPESGRRRRARVRDRTGRALRQARGTVDAGTRDLSNRGSGLAARLRSRFQETGPVADDVLVQRVRSRLGRFVSHPGAIEVSVAEGTVTLTGPVLRHERARLVDAIREVDGVRDVADRLTEHATGDRVPELQGGRDRPGERSALRQENWAPGTRLAAGAAAGALLLYAFRGGAAGLLAGTLGALLLARSTANRPLRQLAGHTSQGIDVHRSITIDAPVEELFDFFSNVENFPRFMHHVRRVEPRGDGRSHWVVEGPAGAEVEWDSVITRCEPNRLLAWQTTDDSQVRHSGTIRFERAGTGTRLHVRMKYSPPAGAAGHAVAKLFGKDARSEIDENLMRLKTTLEEHVPGRSPTAERSTGDGGTATVPH